MTEFQRYCRMCCTLGLILKVISSDMSKDWAAVWRCYYSLDVIADKTRQQLWPQQVVLAQQAEQKYLTDIICQQKVRH